MATRTLITVQYVQNAMATTFTASDTARCAQFIDEMSEYVYETTGEDFTNPNEHPDGVPATVKGVVCRAVIRGMSSDPSNLKSLAVGDVVEVYGGLYDFPPGDQRCLDLAGGSAYTIYLDCE